MQIEKPPSLHTLEFTFRESAGELVAVLANVFGPAHLQLAEDVVQDAFLRAIKLWPVEGVPENPKGWLYQTAKNRAINAINRSVSFQNKETEIARQLEQHLRIRAPDATLEVVHDDQLRMMFMCCDPAIPENARLCLTLKVVCGFGVGEIAKAFLSKEPTIAQRLVRAKRSIKQAQLALHLPAPAHLPRRLDAVLRVLYMLFNEGYSATEGDQIIRADLCREAIRLANLLLENKTTAKPVVHALLALMYLQSSRFNARLDEAHCLVPLPEQDRSLWDQRMIQRGHTHLHLAGKGTALTVYHIEAGIAACHAIAPNYEATDWPVVLHWYNQLIAMTRSPVVALNRAVVLSYINGPQTGIAALDEITAQIQLQDYYLLPATYADFHARSGDSEKAKHYFQQALDLAKTNPERNYLKKRISQLFP